MVREALALRDAVGESFYVKIPAVPEGLRAMPALKKEGLKVTASGGISFEEELVTLDKLGTWGAILGKALYTGRLDLKAAVEIAGN